MDHLDDYKVIRKSVETLNKKVQAAKDMGVELSDDTLRLVNHCNSRLVSERNLRFNMESVKVQQADHDNVKELTDLIDSANKNRVEDTYIKKAEKF